MKLKRKPWPDAAIPALRSACVITTLPIIAPGRVPGNTSAPQFPFRASPSTASTWRDSGTRWDFAVFVASTGFTHTTATRSNWSHVARHTSTCRDAVSAVNRIARFVEGAQAKHVDGGWLRRAGNPIQHEVPASSPNTRHVKCHETLRNFVAASRSRDVRSIGESLDGARRSLAVDTRLGMSEPLSGPENVPKIVLGRGAQPNAPAAVADHCSVSAFDDRPASASAERAER